MERRRGLLRRSQLWYLAVFVLGVAAFASPALADTNPPGCFATGISLSVAAFYQNGTPVGADPVEAGEPIYFQAFVNYPGFPTCYTEGGDLAIGLPNGTNVSVTPIGGIPLITENVTINSTLANYIVSPADVSGGLLTAIGFYRNGTAHLGANVQGVNATTPTIVLFQETPLNISKNASTQITRIWNWTIDKNGSATNLTLLPGQNGSVNYTVAVNATLVNETYAASGFITIRNPSQFTNATITNVSDVMGGAAAVVDCGAGFPITLAPNQTIVCSYSANLTSNATLNNTAVVTTNGSIPGGNATAPVDFANATVTEIDESVVVNDSFAGVLGNATAGNQTVFNYTRIINGTNCSNETVAYNNTAQFTTTDTNTTGTDNFTVLVAVPCLDGCTLTQGYWKTHAGFGGPRFDETWLEILPSGPNSTFYLSGQTYYQVMAASGGGNAYYNLAQQFIAAQLNVLNNASAPANVTAALANATSLFSTYTPAQIGALKGNNAIRQQFITLAGILGSYNEGLIGPGHCTETNTTTTV